MLRGWRCDECKLVHAVDDFTEVEVEEYSGKDQLTMGGSQRIYWTITYRLCASCIDDIAERTRAEDPWDERNPVGTSEEAGDAVQVEGASEVPVREAS